MSNSLLYKIKYIFLSFFVFLSLSSQTYGQNITLTGNIFEYATYYINSFDLSTGATNVQIFRYQLTSDEFPVDIKINFRSSMISPTLGINSDQTIIEIQTNVPYIFTLSGPNGCIMLRAEPYKR